MMIVEQHDSPDGILRLVVIREDNGDMSIGFSGCSWHTHGDILSAESGKTESDAIREFVDGIVADAAVLAVSRMDGDLRDVWPTDDPLAEVDYQHEKETLEFRRWSGAKVEFPSRP